MATGSLPTFGLPSRAEAPPSRVTPTATAGVRRDPVDGLMADLCGASGPLPPLAALGLSRVGNRGLPGVGLAGLAMCMVPATCVGELSRTTVPLSSGTGRMRRTLELEGEVGSRVKRLSDTCLFMASYPNGDWFHIAAGPELVGLQGVLVR